MPLFAQRIISPHNTKVGFLRSLHQSKGRKDAQAFFIEGPHLVEEAIKSHIALDLVLAVPEVVTGTPLEGELTFLAEEGLEVIAATPQIIERVCETQTPQGIVAVVPFSAVAPERMRRQRRGRMRPLVLALDDLRDPGNVGTILRSALAADVDAVLLTPNCADPFAPKVVRAASGAHFRLPILPQQSWANIQSYLAGAPKTQQVLVADAVADKDYAEVDLTQRTAIIIGNEAHGPSPQARKLATHHIRIPMYNGVESLNAAIATSVILFESVRQRKAQEA